MIGSSEFNKLNVATLIMTRLIASGVVLPADHGATKTAELNQSAGISLSI